MGDTTGADSAICRMCIAKHTFLRMNIVFPLQLLLLIALLGRVLERVPREDLALEALGGAAGLHGDLLAGADERVVPVANGGGFLVVAGAA